MKIRQAISSDEISACVMLRKAVFMAEQNVSLEEEIDGRDSEAIHFLGGAITAPQCVARVRLIDKTAKIERVCVALKRRRTGLGTALMQHIHLALACDPKVERFKLEAQTQALKFYEKLGYVVEGDEFQDAGIAHFMMTRSA